MCGLLKRCVNCKYYEHVVEVDNETHYCSYLNQEGTISEISGRTCGYYKPADK